MKYWWKLNEPGKLKVALLLLLLSLYSLTGLWLFIGVLLSQLFIELKLLLLFISSLFILVSVTKLLLLLK